MLSANKGLNLTQQIAHTLGKAIVAGVYGDHNPVPSEAVLCEQLQVSRSAAREAVKSLAAKGLIMSRARQGIRVLPESEWNLFDADVLGWIRDSNPSLELLREFAELRIAIETQAARLATIGQDPEKIAQIERALERMRAAELGRDDPLEADIAFHVSILHATGNRFFIQMSRIIDTTLRVSIRLTNLLSGVDAAPYATHRPVYEAIAANQPEQAAREIEKLVTVTHDLITGAIHKPTDRVNSVLQAGAQQGAPWARGGFRNKILAVGDRDQPPHWGLE